MSIDWVKLGVVLGVLFIVTLASGSLAQLILALFI